MIIIIMITILIITSNASRPNPNECSNRLTSESALTAVGHEAVKPDANGCYLLSKILQYYLCYYADYYFTIYITVHKYIYPSVII